VKELIEKVNTKKRKEAELKLKKISRVKRVERIFKKVRDE